MSKGGLTKKVFHEVRRETFVTAVNVWNALYTCDRFMIRLPAKFDLAAPEADSEVESDQDFHCTYLKPLASSQVWLRGERSTTSGLEVRRAFPMMGGWALRPSIM